jgi:membrane protein implicated in regulation of membrane protease activity
LVSEKNPNIGNIIAFSAFVLAALAIVMSISNDTLLNSIIVAVIGVVLLIMYVRVIRPYGRRAREAGKLLNDIMLGNERDLSKIEERWKRVLAEGKTKEE